MTFDEVMVRSRELRSAMYLTSSICSESFNGLKNQIAVITYERLHAQLLADNDLKAAALLRDIIIEINMKRSLQFTN